MNALRLLVPLSLALAAPLARSQGTILLFQGQPGGAGDVVIADLDGFGPPQTVPGLSGVTLRPLDANGRTVFDGMRTDRPQFRGDVPGASRLSLPDFSGSLYSFSRPAAAGRAFGLFVADAQGDVRILLELPGVGPALDQPPFLDVVAVAPAGDFVLVATVPAAGGDLLEVEIASGAVLDRTATAPPQAFLARGLHLSAAWGTAATAQRVWRFDRTTSDRARPLTFPNGGPATFSGEIALSRNGEWAVTTGGPGAGLLHVFAFGPTGDAVRVTSVPAPLSPAGFLPDVLHGPFLAISDDGTCVAWRTEDAISTEAYLAAVPGGAPGAGEWLTSDANYIDTIDEIGQFLFKIGSTALIYAAGEPAGGLTPNIENVDFYEAQLAGSGAAILNLTQSNGLAQPPFVVPSDLSPLHVSQDPSSQALIFYSERSGGTGDLLKVVPGQVGYTVLVPNVKDVEFIARAGDDLLVDLQRKQGADPRELYRFAPPYLPSNAPILTVPGPHRLERVAPRADGWFAFVERTPLQERLWRAAPGAGAAQFLTNRPLLYGPAIAWGTSGELVFGVGGLASLFAKWPTAEPVQRLGLPIAPGFVLPSL